MPAIVEFPEIVQEAVKVFSPLFPNEPQHRHFAEYLTGLFVAERKNVTAINREFAETTDPSCLNRFLTDAAWDVEALNRARLALLQQDADTRYHPRGVIAIDNVLWGGQVAQAGSADADTKALQALNAKIHRDQRVDLALLPIGDGLTLAMKR